MYVFFFINFISQHVPLQKAILRARDCLYLTCATCFYIFTTDCLLRNTHLVLMHAYSCLKCRPVLCVLQSVKVYRIHKHLKPFCVCMFVCMYVCVHVCTCKHVHYEIVLASLVVLSGLNSSVGIETRYGLGGPLIDSRWALNFPHVSRQELGPTKPPVQ